MVLEEKKSIHLGVPYVYIPDQKKFLCSNGVLFTLEEYKKGIDINAEYIRREKEDKLYDYAYAKSTGLLRKKRGTAVPQNVQEDRKADTQTAEKSHVAEQDNEGIHEESIQKAAAEVPCLPEQEKSPEVASEEVSRAQRSEYSSR